MARGAGGRGKGGRKRQPEEEPQSPLEAEVTGEMEASGRSHVTPREGLVGAHEERREAGADREALGEPVGRGAAVAPTARAEERERERHRLEREAGRVPAGEQGLLRQERPPEATRAVLDRAAAEADRRVAARGRAGEGRLGRAWTWMKRRPALAAASAVAVLAVAGAWVAWRRA